MTNKIKNIYISGLLGLTTLFSANTVLAQTCVKAPDCTEIGFTKTAADCKGKTILKCPFDTNQVYCPGYEESTKTYKVGDIYVDANGIGIGVVTSVDRSGLHGRLISSTGYRGTASEAQSFCVSKTTGGLDWGAASGETICSAAKNKYISILFYTTPCNDMPTDSPDNLCDSSPVISPGSATAGICTASGFCGTWSICSGCTPHKCTQTSAMFYCEASF